MSWFWAVLGLLVILFLLGATRWVWKEFTFPVALLASAVALGLAVCAFVWMIWPPFGRLLNPDPKVGVHGGHIVLSWADLAMTAPDGDQKACLRKVTGLKWDDVVGYGQDNVGTTKKVGKDLRVILVVGDVHRTDLQVVAELKDKGYSFKETPPVLRVPSIKAAFSPECSTSVVDQPTIAVTLAVPTGKNNNPYSDRKGVLDNGVPWTAP